jgi:hypothetical protein
MKGLLLTLAFSTISSGNRYLLNQDDLRPNKNEGAMLISDSKPVRVELYKIHFVGVKVAITYVQKH